jgi:hypothetical protein
MRHLLRTLLRATMLFPVIIVVALAARVLLDMASLTQPDWRLELGYAALFAVVAGASLIHDPRDLFGYMSLLACASCGVKAARCADESCSMGCRQ